MQENMLKEILISALILTMSITPMELNDSDGDNMSSPLPLVNLSAKYFADCFVNDALQANRSDVEIPNLPEEVSELVKYTIFKYHGNIVWRTYANSITSVVLDHNLSVRSIAISSDSSFIVTISGREADVWDSKHGERIYVLADHNNGISSAAISSNNKFIATGSWDSTAKIWDSGTGKCLRTLIGHTQGVTCIAISADSKFIVTGS